MLPSDWLALTATRVINPCPKGTPRPRRSRTGRQYGYQVAASCQLNDRAARRRLFRRTGAYSATIPAQRHGRSPWQRIVLVVRHSECSPALNIFNEALFLRNCKFANGKKVLLNGLMRGSNCDGECVKAALLWVSFLPGAKTRGPIRGRGASRACRFRGAEIPRRQRIDSGGASRGLANRPVTDFPARFSIPRA